MAVTRSAALPESEPKKRIAAWREELRRRARTEARARKRRMAHGGQGSLKTASEVLESRFRARGPKESDAHEEGREACAQRLATHLRAQE